MKESTASCHHVPAALLGVMGAVLLAAGCAERTKGLFTLPKLQTYQRLAVLGLTPEQEQLFMACYIRRFSEQPTTFVERARLQDILGEQDLLRVPQDRLDKTRAKMRQILGVEALIMCTYEDSPQGPGMKKLRVRIVDSETGAIVGSVITEARGDFESHCHQAVRALKQDLYRGLHKDDLNPEPTPTVPRVVG